MLKKILFVVVALALLGLLAFQFLFVNIPVATGPLEVGSVIKSTDISMKRFLFNDVPEIALKGADIIIGKVATAKILPGSVFMAYAVSESTGGSGSVAGLTKDTVIVPLIVDAKNVPVSLRVGDIVKIVAFFENNESTAKPAFTLSFPSLATVKGIKKSESGLITGVDVLTSTTIGTPLIVASIQGTIALIQVNIDAVPVTNGFTVESIYNNYFFGVTAN